MNREPIALWIVGEPGAGKTALARALLARDPESSLATHDAGNGCKFTLRSGIVAFGLYDGRPFDGADTVPISSVKPCLAAHEAHHSKAPLTLLDGDKFANANAVLAIGKYARCLCVHLETSEAAARRAARSTKVQNAAWVRGRVTKARRFAECFNVDRCALFLDSGAPVESLRDVVLAWLEGHT